MQKLDVIDRGKNFLLSSICHSMVTTLDLRLVSPSVEMLVSFSAIDLCEESLKPIAVSIAAALCRIRPKLTLVTIL